MKPLQLRYAYRWWQRVGGLLGQPRLCLGEGLLLHPCRAVHAWGMRYPLDIVFLDHEFRIVKTGVLAPGGWMVCGQARSVLELAPGSLAYYGWQVGERLPGLARGEPG